MKSSLPTLFRTRKRAAITLWPVSSRTKDLRARPSKPEWICVGHFIQRLRFKRRDRSRLVKPDVLVKLLAKIA
jgi:hypothetical protein